MAKKQSKARLKPQPKYQSPIRVGNKVFIRTVTHHHTGEIVLLTKEEIVLKDAAWIADDGRFSDAIATGNLNEIEPFPDGVLASVMRGALIDVCDWKHALPRTKK